MDVSSIALDRDEAVRMWKKYQTHKHHQTPIDAEVERIYGAIAKGKLVVRALESIRKAGLGTDGLPKLAIARADAKRCHCIVRSDGSAQMSDQAWTRYRAAKTRFFDFEPGAFPGAVHRSGHEAIVPHIPPDIRPKRGIQNYHILWEAVWSKRPPIDPMLLRRIGAGDMWLVCGAWDLTDVERAVMADRLDARH